MNRNTSDNADSDFTSVVSGVNTRNICLYPLMVASQSNDTALVSSRLMAGANVNSLDDQGRTAVFYTTSGEIVTKLLDAGLDPNIVATNGLTALHYFCREGCIDPVTALLSHGVDTQTRTTQGLTALMIAVRHHPSSLAIVQALLKHTPELIDARSMDGMTALYLAVANSCVSIVSELLDAGADVHITDEDNMPLPPMCEHIDIVRKLVAHGANINAQCSEGNTLLRWTCKYGNTDLVSYLLDIKADASMPNYDLCTPLIAACEEDNADVVQLLLERSDAAKACIDEQMADEETALITASRVNAVSCVKLLIAAGADVHLSEGFGLTALHLTDDVEIARMLIGAGATDARDNDGYTAMMRACNVGVPDLLKVLLEHGFDVNAVSNTGTSALMIAARNSPSTLQVLLSANPPPDMNKKCSRGYTALRYAAEQGSYEAVEMLLNAGADPTLADLCGITPLMQACDPETVRLLVNAAPDSVHRRCEIGRNALSYLSEKPLTSDALVSLLECDSAYNLCLDVNAANDVGDTTLHFAMGDANVVAVELLLEKGADMFHIGYRGTTVLMTLLQVGASTMAEEEDEDNEDEDDISLDEDMENGDEDMDEGDDDENSVISVAGASKCVELILDHVLWRAD